MENKGQPSVGKTIAWVYGTVAVFTTLYLAVPIFLDRLQTRKRQK